MSDDQNADAGYDEPMLGRNTTTEENSEQLDSGFGSADATGSSASLSSSLNVSLSSGVNMSLDSSLNASLNASRSATPTNETVLAEAAAEALLTDPRNSTLFKTALDDVKTGRLSKQINKEASAEHQEWIRAREASLRQRAAQLLDQLDSRGRSGVAVPPSAKQSTEMQNTVNEYFGLLRWIKPGETLASKQLNINVLDTNGGVQEVVCDLAGTVEDLQTAVSTRLGPHCSRQLLCNGKPMTKPNEALYQWAANHGLGVRSSTVVQVVARTNGG